MSSFHVVYYCFFDVLVWLDHCLFSVTFQKLIYPVLTLCENQKICIMKKTLKLDQPYEHKELEKGLFNPHAQNCKAQSKVNNGLLFLTMYLHVSDTSVE
jgi:hypothetical protein